MVIAQPFNAEWTWGCLYLAAYAAWAWLFRSHLDRWARRLLGRRLGVDIVWLPMTTFPLEMWIWGISERGDERRPSRFDPRVALGSAAICRRWCAY